MGSDIGWCLQPVGEVWTSLNADRGSTFDLFATARFITGCCHLGAFALPWNIDECVVCTWCGNNFTWDHVSLECTGLCHEISVFLTGTLGVLGGWFCYSALGLDGSYDQLAGCWTRLDTLCDSSDLVYINLLPWQQHCVFSFSSSPVHLQVGFVLYRELWGYCRPKVGRVIWIFDRSRDDHGQSVGTLCYVEIYLFIHLSCFLF